MKNKNKQVKLSQSIYQPEKLEMYKAFMTGYVKRINEATFNVPIGGVRIGLAKYSRLAQINLQSRIITFSCYAIENVPERGRRYLVLHELAHVKETNHTKRFWQLVANYEPDYRQIGKRLEIAFKQNVNEEERKPPLAIVDKKGLTLISKPNLSENNILSSSVMENDWLTNMAISDVEEEMDHSYDCQFDDFLNWTVE